MVSSCNKRKLACGVAVGPIPDSHFYPSCTGCKNWKHTPISKIKRVQAGIRAGFVNKDMPDAASEVFFFPSLPGKIITLQGLGLFARPGPYYMVLAAISFSKQIIRNRVQHAFQDGSTGKTISQGEGLPSSSILPICNCQEWFGGNDLVGLLGPAWPARPGRGCRLRKNQPGLSSYGRVGKPPHPGGCSQPPAKPDRFLPGVDLHNPVLHRWEWIFAA